VAGSGGRFAWGATKVVLGLVVFVLTFVLSHACAHALVPVPFAIVIDVVALVLVPIGLTRLLLPALRRIDKTTRFINTLPGMTVVWCLIVLVALPWAARAWVARVLVATPHTERDVPAWVTRAVARVGGWLTPKPPPAAPPPRRPTPVVHVADAGVVRDAAVRVAAIDASAARIDASVRAPAHDAGRDVAVHVDVGVVSTDAAHAVLDAGVESPVAESSLAIDVTVCREIRSLRAIDLGQGTPDELVIACEDGVHVFWIQEQGVLYARTLFTYVVPQGLELAARDPWVADLDGDGHRDVALCAYYMTDRGGTRGGKSWWARGRPDGQFAEPTGLDDGECAAITTGDVTGDGQDELLVVREGNPWDPQNPDGALFWFARDHARWQMRGNARLFRDPQRVWVADGNHDGIGDVFVSDESGPRAWFVGSPRGPQRVDAGMPNVTPPPLVSYVGDFDGDGRPDRIEVDGGRLHVETTTPRAVPIRSVARALDFVEHPLVGR
jgi:hypothetical protein